MAAAHPITTFSFGSTSARFVWSGLLPGGRGHAIELPEYSRLDLEVIGDFDGARLGLEASNDGHNFGFLAAPLQKPGTVTLNAKPAFVRPVVVGGSAGTLLQCAVIATRA